MRVWVMVAALLSGFGRVGAQGRAPEFEVGAIRIWVKNAPMWLRR